MSWFSDWFHKSLVPMVEKTVSDTNVQNALTDMIKGIISTALSNPSNTTAILKNAAQNAEKLVGAAVAGTPAQGLVDAAILPPATPPAPATTVPASEGTPPAA